ncbi:zinc ribbon domain-containing protein [Enorma phocaeensis]|uniref:Zinc-ribbon domain-containing protein n=1 Tax=Enorma phocaeensis TaxID=1871019 RepID=A0A921IV93_9ACTN|nr:zinc-ribbon domain-containing protein [Enorma phocaeensis]HJG36675.1 zinc-ribbon domain-containing protein [Enorma phocaeensis]
MEAMITLIVFLWGACYWAQLFFGFGTAYRYAKRGGDNGVALFGWLLVFGCAAAVPGLGIYFWSKEKKEAKRPKEAEQIIQPTQPQVVYIAQPMPQQVISNQASQLVRASSSTPATGEMATGTVDTASSASIGAIAVPPAPAGVVAAPVLSVDAAAPSSVVSIASDGSSVVKPVCPACGHILPSDSKFCEYCGAPLGVAAADADTSEPEEQ